MLAAAGFAITVAAFHPGILSTDSVTQYEQALSGHYTDHHPPIMAALWSLTNRIVRGPQGMLLLHVALVWSALLLFADGAARRGVRHAWLIVVVGFLPPVIGIEGMIWKDVGMAAALLFATSLVYRARAANTGIGRPVAVLALLPLCYAAAVRANAPAAAAPMLVYWASAVFPRASMRGTVAIAAAALSAMLVAQWTFETRILHVERSHLTQYLEAFDLTAIHCAGGNAALPPPMVRTQAWVTPLCATFDPVRVDFLFASGVGSPLAASYDNAVLHELARDWRHALVANPMLYLAHRFRVFAAELGFGVEPRRRLLWSTQSRTNDYGFTFTPNAITRAIGVAVAATSAAGLYNGSLWLAVAAAVLVFSRRMRTAWRDDAAAMLAVSAFTYTLPYFFVALAPDYRYIYWTVMASAVAAMLTALRALDARVGTSPFGDT